jgi:hypothetical protein
MLHSTSIAIVALAGLMPATAPAMGYTPDEDEVACQGRKVGAACVDDDGAQGTCQPDDDPPHVLKCQLRAG